MSGADRRPALVLRDARDGDMPAIQAIYAHHVRTGLASFEETPPDVEEMRRRRADILARGLPYVVVECGAQIGGYAYAGPYRARSAYRFSVEDFGLRGAGPGRQRHRPAGSSRNHRAVHGGRLAADGGRDRRFGQYRLDRPT